MASGKKDKKHSREELRLEDKLDDLFEGLEVWKDIKIRSMDLTVADEMLLRWIEYNKERF